MKSSVAEAIAHAPDRLVGYFMVNPLADDAPARVERGLGTLGLKGVCLFPAMHRYHLEDTRSLAVIARVASYRGAVLFVHCGALTVGVRKRLGLRSRFDVRFGNPLDLHHIASDTPQCRSWSAFRRRPAARSADAGGPVPQRPSRHVQLEPLGGVSPGTDIDCGVSPGAGSAGADTSALRHRLVVFLTRMEPARARRADRHPRVAKRARPRSRAHSGRELRQAIS